MALEKEKEVLQNALQTAQLAVDATSANLEKAHSFLRAFDEEATLLKQQENVCESALMELEVLAVEQEQSHSRSCAKKSAASQAVSKLMSQHPWIEDEQERLRDPTSEYHLSAEAYANNAHRLRQLESILKDLKRRVNLKVNSMIDRSLSLFASPRVYCPTQRLQHDGE